MVLGPVSVVTWEVVQIAVLRPRGTQELWPRGSVICVLTNHSTLVWLGGLSAGLRTEKLAVLFPVRAQTWVAGKVPSEGPVRGNRLMYFTHECFSHSLSPFLPFSLNINKTKSWKKHYWWLGCMSSFEKHWSRRKGPTKSVPERLSPCSAFCCRASQPHFNWPPEGDVGTGLTCRRRCPWLDNGACSPFCPKPMWLSYARHTYMPARRVLSSLPNWFASCGAQKYFVEGELLKDTVNLNILISQSMWLSFFFKRVFSFHVIGVPLRKSVKEGSIVSFELGLCQ